jgi:hypothetical protein
MRAIDCDSEDEDNLNMGKRISEKDFNFMAFEIVRVPSREISDCVEIY